MQEDGVVIPRNC